MLNFRPTVYFTIFPSSGCGFTDQLIQFSSYYKLGISLGYRYFHTKFKASRSSEKIYDFLEFNNSFTSRKILKIKFKVWQKFWFKKQRILNIELSDKLIQEHNIISFTDLQTFVKELVLKHSNSFSRGDIIVKFKHGIGMKFFSLIQTQIPEFPDGLNLYLSYLKNRIKQPRKTIFAENKLKLLIHIRQGDTAIIETPWQSYISLWKPFCSKFKLAELYGKSEEIFNFNITSNDYYYFTKNFLKYFDENLFSIAVFSDGFKRGFKKLFERIEELDLTSKKIEQLKKFENFYDENKFAIFKSLKNCILHIGETEENLQNLIHSSLTADIIIIGNQGRMIPKLISNYYNLDNPPTIIVLCKSDRVKLDIGDMVYRKHLSLNSNKAKVITVNLNNYNFEDIVTRVSEQILDKKIFLSKKE